MAEVVVKRMPLWQLGALQGTVFGVGWGAFMYHFSWQQKGTSIPLAIGLAVLAGALFGATMMWFEARRRKREDEAIRAEADRSGGGDGPASA